MPYPSPLLRLVLRLVESHLASVERLRGVLAKPLRHPPDRVLQQWVIEDPASHLALRYGIEPDTLGQSFGQPVVQSSVRTQAALDPPPALYLVASSPLPTGKSSADSGIPPPPPRLTPLAVMVLRKRLVSEPSTAYPDTPPSHPVVQINHATAHILPSLSHILPSLSNQETRALAQSHTTENRFQPKIQPGFTTNP